ncbi:MAG: hypothetical protein HC916_06175 [Coleofasciculaceae cyanobacterium SM2_1_6]|nr:hypothetical protein [Coleofasciculaceae cyanobacterium SM2_1_6]
MSLDINDLDNIREEITRIASCYGVFQCIECSQAIRSFLISKNLHGKRIKLSLERRDLPWAVIYDLRREQQISTNGYHEGILIILNEQEIIFDNMNNGGVSRQEWLENLTSPTLEIGVGNFKVVEEEF